MTDIPRSSASSGKSMPPLPARSKPRILYVTPHCPHDPVGGAQVRTLEIIRLLQRCGDVRLVLIPLGEVHPKALERANSEFDIAAVLRYERAPLGAWQRLRREFDPYHTNIDGLGVSRESSSLVRRLRDEHDIVWFHGLRVANSLGQRTWSRSLLDVDDVLSRLHHSARLQNRTPPTWLWHLRQEIVWRRRERVLLGRFSALAVCSEEDKVYLGGSDRIHVIPNGYEVTSQFTPASPVDPPRLGFIGRLQHAPNLDGLRWFIRQVWPLIKTTSPQARLRLIGRGTETGISQEGPDIDGLGWIDDPAAEIATWSATVVPIRIGAGTRVKIAEAFSRRCPVVATPLGAFGYDVAHRRELLLADTPGEFAAACQVLMTDRNLGQELARRAWQRFEREWSWDAIAPKVADAVAMCLERGTGAELAAR